MTNATVVSATGDNAAGGRRPRAAHLDAGERLLAFKEAMSTFPSGVTIVTTVDSSGVWRGFTATSFCSVSMDPPLVLVCLDTGAECHDAFRASERWNVHVISREDADLALTRAIAKHSVVRVAAPI